MAETLLLTSGRTQYAEPAPADGSVAPFSINDAGRLRVASKQGLFPILSGDLTAVGNTLVVDVAEASNIVCHVKNTGTASMAAGAFVFEGSIDSTNGTDGTWFALQAVRSNANTIEGASGTLTLAVGAGLTYSWELSVNAVRWFRVRCTTAVTANSIATWSVLRGSYATEPIPASQISGTQPVSGTVTASPTSATGYSLTTAATTNAAAVKTSAASLFEITVFNATAATIFVKLYNLATAPTVGTSVPIVTIPVAAGAYLATEFGSIGKRLAAGLSIAVTGAAAATDATAVAAGAQISASYL